MTALVRYLDADTGKYETIDAVSLDPEYHEANHEALRELEIALNVRTGEETIIELLDRAKAKGGDLAKKAQWLRKRLPKLILVPAGNGWRIKAVR